MGRARRSGRRAGSSNRAHQNPGRWSIEAIAQNTIARGRPPSEAAPQQPVHVSEKNAAFELGPAETAKFISGGWEVGTRAGAGAGSITRRMSSADSVAATSDDEAASFFVVVKLGDWRFGQGRRFLHPPPGSPVKPRSPLRCRAAGHRPFPLVQRANARGKLRRGRWT